MKTKKTHKHTTIFPKQLMCVRDVEHDFKYSVFKTVVYVEYEFTFFLVFKFLIGRWSEQLVGGRLVSDRWSVVGWPIHEKYEKKCDEQKISKLKIKFTLPVFYSVDKNLSLIY